MIRAAAVSFVLASAACAPAPAHEPQKPRLGFFITSTSLAPS